MQLDRKVVHNLPRYERAEVCEVYDNKQERDERLKILKEASLQESQQISKPYTKDTIFPLSYRASSLRRQSGTLYIIDSIRPRIIEPSNFSDVLQKLKEQQHSQVRITALFG